MLARGRAAAARPAPGAERDLVASSARSSASELDGRSGASPIISPRRLDAMGSLTRRSSLAGARYVELHCHSAYSFLDGASQPEELAARAAELGYEALALTDHDGVYGSLEFAHAAKARASGRSPARR